MSKRRMTVKVHDVRVEKGWASSKLWKSAVIRIESPYDVNYIREKLAEIEAYWKERLGVKP